MSADYESIRHMMLRFMKSDAFDVSMLEVSVDLLRADAEFNTWLGLEIKERQPEKMEYYLDLYEEIEGKVLSCVESSQCTKNSQKFIDEIGELTKRLISE